MGFEFDGFFFLILHGQLYVELRWKFTLYNAEMFPAEDIWLFRNLQNFLLVGSARSNLDLRRCLLRSFISEISILIWCLRVSSSLSSLRYSWGGCFTMGSCNDLAR